MLKFITIISIVLLSTVAYSAKQEQTKQEFIQSEINCLGKTIYREARGEKLLGKVFVGEVVINRSKHPDYPKTVCSVVHQKGLNSHGKIICQFSWNCNKHLPPIYETESFESYYLAKMIYNGQLKDISKGSLYFFQLNELKYTKGMKIVKVVQFGSHIGFKNKV